MQSWSPNVSPQVVVVNDCPLQLRMASAVLEKAGMRVASFAGVEAALSHMKGVGGVPHLVITDLHMPDIDGWQFCRMLRSADYAELNGVPILATSAIFGGADTEAITADAGADAFLPLPYSGAVLCSFANQLIAGKKPKKTPSVLVVDEDHLLAERMARTFRSQGFQAVVAGDRASAQSLFFSMHPEVVVLDNAIGHDAGTGPSANGGTDSSSAASNVASPSGSGGTPPGTPPGNNLLEAFRKALPKTVIVIIAADESPTLALDSLKRGADGFVRKPFDVVYLLNICRKAQRQRSLLVIEDLLQKRTAQLAHSERRYRAVVESQTDLVCRFRPDSSLTFVNRAFSKYFGAQPRALMEKKFSAFLSKESLATMARCLAPLKERSEEASCELQDKDPKGNVRWQHWLFTAFRDSEGRVVDLQAVGRDITARKQFEARLVKTNACFLGFTSDPEENIQRLTQLLGESFQASCALYMRQHGGHLQSVGRWNAPDQVPREAELNAGLCRHLLHHADKRPVVLRNLHEKGDPAGVGAARALGFQTCVGHPVILEEQVVGAACAFFAADYQPTEDDLTFLGIVAGALGVEEERRRAQEQKASLEEQLRHSQRMESIGRLAGGVAHDFNNLLTGITGNVELALLDLDRESPLYEVMMEIGKAAKSARNLTGQLLAFSRRQRMEPKVFCPNGLLKSLRPIMARLIGEDVQLRLVLSDDLGKVKADRGQLEQVLINLVVNGRDAMPEGGVLTLESSNVFLNGHCCRTHQPVLPGHYILLSVQDTGCGMDEETQDHIFEPFFTTKPAGKGTGLGLATVYGVVSQNGGFIHVLSEPGEGATFQVYLPRVFDEEEKLSSGMHRLALEYGQGTVFVVEDDVMVRELVVKLLERLGYQVTAFSRGAEAIEAAMRAVDPIHLLMTNVVMSGMNGVVVARAIQECHPDLKVLYTSGNVDNAIVQEARVDKGVHFIGKPYTPQSLSQKVREVLAG